MFLTTSYAQDDVMPSQVRDKYHLLETYSACSAIKGTAPDEWADVLAVLEEFSLDPAHWMKAGGNRGDIAAAIDAAFGQRGWAETRIDVETRGIYLDRRKQIVEETAPIMQEGYLVDNRKGKVVVDVEWNAKDGNLDRDMAAYRAWHEAGLIVGAVLITKHLTSLRVLANKLWSDYQEKIHPSRQNPKLPMDVGTTTTTTFEKSELRIKRGTGGTCPLLIVAVSDKTWNGKPYPFDPSESLPLDEDDVDDD